MEFRMYNTKTRTKEVFVPLQKEYIGMYTCGPTVYYYPHIGNMKAYVMWDIAKKTMQYLGYSVRHVMNITDVGHLTSDEDIGEDKMEKGAKRDGKTVWEIAEFYTNIFFDNFKILNLQVPDVVCKATDYIQEQIHLVKTLEEKGYTYTIEDGVYFDTSKFPEYGKLALLDREGLQAGIRVEMAVGKKNPTDFALWKFSYSHGRSFDSAQDDVTSRRQMEWDSPWGIGFPGWHIECSAMSMKHLGETFDIHCGGIDHITVHHPNEIAQAECATGKQFVRYWMHCNFMLVEGKKMSKSVGNFYTIDDLVKKGYTGRQIRYLYISSHYRQEQNFTLQGLEQAGNTLKSVDRFIVELQQYTQNGSEHAETILKTVREDFIKAIADDFNIPESLRAMFEMMKIVNPLLHEGKLSLIGRDQVLLVLQELNIVLGVMDFSQISSDIPREVQQLLLDREQARKEKDFTKSDLLRDQIDTYGYTVKDTSQGQKIEKK